MAPVVSRSLRLRRSLAFYCHRAIKRLCATNFSDSRSFLLPFGGEVANKICTRNRVFLQRSDFCRERNRDSFAANQSDGLYVFTLGGNGRIGVVGYSRPERCENLKGWNEIAVKPWNINAEIPAREQSKNVSRIGVFRFQVYRLLWEYFSEYPRLRTT